MSSRWWRANRLWLPLVPVALVAMVAASSYHVKSYWFDQGLHRAVATATPGRYVSVDIPYKDTAGTNAYRFRVRLDGLSRVDRIPDPTRGSEAVPPGATAYRVKLSYAADPSVALSRCLLTLVAADGSQYDEDLGQAELCVPQRHPGPDPAIVKGAKRGAVLRGGERPRTWRRAPVLLVQKGVRPVEVRLWFGRPDYVSLPVPH